MLLSLAIIFLVGLSAAALFERIGLPRIIGMLAVGILVSPYVLDLLDEMRESFGEYASILHDEDADYVRIRVRVGINRKFYLWLMQYGDGVELVSPAKERAEYLDEVRKMLGAYPEFAK